MTGSTSQIEWAEQIKPRVGAEFDRVAQAFAAIAQKQQEPLRSDTEAVIAILREKRAETMARQEAGYFIRDWQELTDQVQQMIRRDSRYQEIRTKQSVSKKEAHKDGAN